MGSGRHRRVNPRAPVRDRYENWSTTLRRRPSFLFFDSLSCRARSYLLLPGLSEDGNCESGARRVCRLPRPWMSRSKRVPAASGVRRCWNARVRSRRRYTDDLRVPYRESGLIGRESPGHGRISACSRNNPSTDRKRPRRRVALLVDENKSPTARSEPGNQGCRRPEAGAISLGYIYAGPGGSGFQ